MEGTTCSSPCTSGLGGSDETQSQTFPEIGCEVPAARGPSHARVGAHAAGAQDWMHAERILSPGAQEGVLAQRRPASCPDPTGAHTPVRALQGRDPPAASF